MKLAVKLQVSGCISGVKEFAASTDVDERVRRYADESCLHYWIAPKLTLCPWAETARQIWRSLNDCVQYCGSTRIARHCDLAVVG